MMTGDSGPDGSSWQCEKTVLNQRLKAVNLIWLTVKIDFDLKLSAGEALLHKPPYVA